MLNRISLRNAASTLSAVILVIGYPGLSAHSQILDNQELANARMLVQENQESIIREDLRLNAEEEANFWPLYKEYRADVRPIQDRYVQLIADYLSSYRTGVTDDEFAEEMLDDYFDIKADLLNTRESYIRKFRRILPMVKVARFYQLENKFFANIDAELALVVPLIEAN